MLDVRKELASPAIAVVNGFQLGELSLVVLVLGVIVTEAAAVIVLEAAVVHAEHHSKIKFCI